jgi:hypothetical protein
MTQYHNDDGRVAERPKCISISIIRMKHRIHETCPRLSERQTNPKHKQDPVVGAEIQTVFMTMT